MSQDSGWTYIQNKKKKRKGKAKANANANANANADSPPPSPPPRLSGNDVFGHLATLSSSSQKSKSGNNAAGEAEAAAKAAKAAKAEKAKAKAAARKARSDQVAAAWDALQDVGDAFGGLSLPDLLLAAELKADGIPLMQAQILISELERELADSVPLVLGQGEEVLDVHYPLSAVVANQGARPNLAALTEWIDSVVVADSELHRMVWAMLVQGMLSVAPVDRRALPTESSHNGTRLFIQLLARRNTRSLLLASDELAQATVGKNRKSFSHEALYLAAQLAPVAAIVFFPHVARVSQASTAVWPNLVSQVFDAFASPPLLSSEAETRVAGPPLSKKQWNALFSELDPKLDAFLAALPESERVSGATAKAAVRSLRTLLGARGAAWLTYKLLPFTTHTCDRLRATAVTELVALIGANPTPVLDALLEDFSAKVGAVSNILAGVHVALSSDNASLVFSAPDALSTLESFTNAVMETIARLPELTGTSPYPNQVSAIPLTLTPEIIEVCSDNAAAVNGLITNATRADASSSTSGFGFGSGSGSGGSGSSSCCCCGTLFSTAIFIAHKALLFGMGLSIGAAWLHRDELALLLKNAQHS